MPKMKGYGSGVSMKSGGSASGYKAEQGSGAKGKIRGSAHVRTVAKTPGGMNPMGRKSPGKPNS